MWNRRPFITFRISCDVEKAKNKLQYCCPSGHGHGLQELDLQASTLRKARKLLCRSYISLGPNAAWHVNGYDKLKPYGLPIRDCGDGFSRRILCLKVCKNNNDSVIQASFSSMQWKKTDCDQCWGKRLWPGCLTVPFIRWNGCTSLLIFTCQSAHPKLVVT